MVPAPEVVNRILPDLSESEEEVEENGAALRRIYGARKMGAMTEEQQRFYEKMQERKRMIRRRTQTWIVCEGTHVQLDEEEQRLFEEASKLIFFSLRDPNRLAYLTAQFERLLTMIPPQNRYGYYSLHLHFNDSRHQGLTEFAKLLTEDDYETPVETLIREEARLAEIDSSDHLPQEDGFSACVLRARLTGGAYTPTVPSSDPTGPFVRFQELLASGSRSDPFEKRREELVWTMKKHLKAFVSEECGFDFSQYERIYEVGRSDDHDY